MSEADVTGQPKASPAAAVDGEKIETFDVKAVNQGVSESLYKKREPIYPKRVHGKYRFIKWVLLAATLGVYYILPWIRWPRGVGEPDQAVLVDFPGQRFYFFFIEIWPDELYYVTGLLILGAVGLFLATALFGRVWCGYTCPQTVWTDLFIAVERLVEGDRNKRIRLAKEPWTFGKIRKKITKHVIWLFIALSTGGAWIFYFHDAPTIFPQIFRGEAPFSAYLFMVMLTVTTYLLAGSMREQVCTYMCPWPRIQAALTDEESLQVTYKYDRGEPRGAHKKSDSWDGRGDCIDCKACVAACPMGIDIRDGAQLECINCALCIDACNDIMVKVDRPLHLIGYDTDKNIAHRIAGEKTSVKIIRSRTVFYGAVWTIVAAIMLAALVSRATLETNIIRDRTPPFVMLSDGSIRNAYVVKIINKANEEREFSIDVKGSASLSLSGVGETLEGNKLIVSAKGDDVYSTRIFITAAPNTITASAIPVTVTVQDLGSDEKTVNKTAFMSGRAK